MNNSLAHPVLFQTPSFFSSTSAATPSQHSQEQIEALKDRYVPLTALRVMPSLLFNVFFSRANIEYVQRALQAQVLRVSGYRIPTQDPNVLLAYMDTVYLSYAQETDEALAVQVVVGATRAEIRRLNAVLLRELLPIAVQNVESTKAQLENFDNPKVVLLPLPVTSSVVGTKHMAR
jgi:hypothetical protein